MEEAVRRALTGADISREGWEALWQGEGDPPPISDAQLEIENIFERLRVQGRLIAELARNEETADDLRRALPQAIERLPTWLTARVHGPPPIDAQALVRDFAELVGVHREALLRVVREQVAEPAEIEAVLESAPVPGADEDDLAEAVGRVSGAHSRVLLLLGRDFDTWAAAA
jgi:hypothetical protein